MDSIVDCKIVELISIPVNAMRVLWMRVYFSSFKSKRDGCRIVSIFVNRDVLYALSFFNLKIVIVVIYKFFFDI